MQVSGIDNIYYLQTIPIYLDSIIRITQNPKTTEVPYEYINNLCLKKTLNYVIWTDLINYLFLKSLLILKYKLFIIF